MRSNNILRLVLMFFLLWPLPVRMLAQLSSPGIPCSFSQAIAMDSNYRVMVEAPSLETLASEDQASPSPYRYAVNLPVDIGITSAGQWIKTSSGMNVWRLSIKSPGAQGLILYFDQFNLPEGGKLFVYNPGRTELLGSFTSLNNNRLSTFATGLIHGDELTVEYNAPDGLPLPALHISEIGHAYRGVSGYFGTRTGFGSAGPCQVNVNCDEGIYWHKEKRSVTRISIKRSGASVWCTGSLVNNVRNDGKPYVLTADHCGRFSSEFDLSQWVFYFNYESTECPDPTKEPVIKSMVGATKVAHGGNAGATGSDFFLALLNAPVPDSFNAYFNGWSREDNQPSPSGVGIHHPQGDIKKISTYTSPLQPAVWSGGSKLAHWRVTFSQTANGHGTTEGGSSGSPLYDNHGLLVGTLTGGDSSCDSSALNSPDYYGMFSYSWDKNGTDSTEVLKYWLDPDNTGVMKLGGWALSVQETQMEESVTFFPNPVTDWLTIKSLKDKNDLHLDIRDIYGKLCLTKILYPSVNPEMQIDMTGFTSGIYLLGIYDGKSRVVRKVVKY